MAFIRMRGGKSQYQDVCFSVTKEFREKLYDALMDCYQQEKANKTLKATVRKAVESLEQQCQKMKEQLFEIKAEVKAKSR